LISRIRSFLRWLFDRAAAPETKSAPEQPPATSIYQCIPVPLYDGKGEPPPLHWAACHPSTMKRFKAQLTCPNGHGLTLRSHSIDSSGAVFPSVVCPSPGCTFHQYVSLQDWTYGPISR
jgi:hypothetical protein